MNLSFHLRLVIALGLFTVMPGISAADASLKTALTFYASFDKGTDADLAKGDKHLHTLVDKQPKAGNHTDNMTRLAKRITADRSPLFQRRVSSAIPCQADRSAYRRHVP